MTNERETLLTADEVAELLQVSRAYVLAHANGTRKDPIIPCVKFGERRNAPVRFRRSDIEALIRGSLKGAA
jgi:predicted DNA-binding transcriptional regulator AlpA